MPRHPSPYDLGCASIRNRSRAQAVKPENEFVIGIFNRKESFRGSQVVIFARITPQEVIQRFFAAIERFAIVLLVNWLFVPCRHN
jgi:hypothetical protein